MRILINTILFLIISTSAWAATSPAIFYSDLTSGPNTGGQNNAGVFVTIWGNNFGSTQGSSTVTVGGGAVANVQTWTNTMVCFQLGSSAATGNIVVTTSSGASNGTPFTVRSGNIYFVQPGASTNGSGTYASPFNHLYYAYNVVAAGDTVYVLSGTINNEIDGYQGWHSVLCITTAGTQAAPIAWIAYPNATVTISVNGETAAWTDGSSGGNDTASYIFRYNGGDWQTISKFNLSFTGSNGNLESEISGTGGDGWKVVGNAITASSYSYDQVDIAGNYSQVIGNTIYNSGAGMSQNNEAHSIYWTAGGTNVQIGWNYLYGNKNSGWEIECFHQGSTAEPSRVGTIHDNLIVATTAGAVKGILLGDVDSGEDETTVEGQNIAVYNNVLVNLGQSENGGAIQAVSGTAYIYNNTIYGSGTENNGTIQFPSGGIGPGGGHPVWYVANNIIYNLISGSLYLSDGNGNAPTWGNFALLTNNNYYGEGNGPSEDLKPLNANPQFVSPGTTTSANFQLQSTSPDINAGYNTTSIVAQDLNGLLRSTVPSIGAYEYTGSTSLLPSTPVVSITSPSNGSSATAGNTVTITATASETNGTIANVYFYNGATLLGSDSTSPYTYNWSTTNVVAGNYILTAVATDTNGVSTTSSPITVTVTAQSGPPSPAVVTITSPINGSSYIAGSSVPVTVTASEVNGSIRYIYLYTGLGIFLGSSPVFATTGSFTYTDSNMTPGGYSFFAVATDINGVPTQSSTVTITVTSTIVAPSITSQPASVTVTAPATATFTVAATGTPTPSYQWEQETPGSGTYTTISGATSSFYTTADTTTSNSGTKFKCVISNAAGSVTSSAATLTVNTASAIPSITSQPASVTVIAPATATFSVTATGTPAPSYQWMQSSGGTYTAISGATSASYTTTATTTANSGTKYECVITNSAGSVTSSAATLTVNTATAAPSITSQPVSVTVSAPATATFTITATGTPTPTYQWMQSVNGGAFTAISGGTGTSYTTAATTTANSGTKYECVATNTTGSATSNSATLTVTGLPVVTITSPSTGSSVTAGSNVSIAATASETNGTITNVSFYNGSTLLGSDSSSPYTYVMSAPSAGSYTLTAVATDANGVSTTSSPVTITVAAQPASSAAVVTITSPTNGSTYVAGSNVPVTVTASETNGSIRYIYLYTGSGVFLGSNAIFATSGSYTYTNSNMAPGTYSFYSVATDVNGVAFTSSTVSFTVTAPSPVVAITSPANNTTLTAGSNMTITASASEINGTISTVFFYNGSTLVGSVSTSPYSITLTNVSAGTYALTAMATDQADNSTTSASITVTVTSSRHHSAG